MPLTLFESKKVKEIIGLMDGDSEKIGKVLDLVTEGGAEPEKKEETVTVEE